MDSAGWAGVRWAGAGGGVRVVGDGLSSTGSTHPKHTTTSSSEGAAGATTTTTGPMTSSTTSIARLGSDGDRLATRGGLPDVHGRAHHDDIAASIGLGECPDSEAQQGNLAVYTDETGR